MKSLALSLLVTLLLAGSIYPSSLRERGFDGFVMIELSNTYPDWPDEGEAVAESVRWLMAYQEERWGG